MMAAGLPAVQSADDARRHVRIICQMDNQTLRAVRWYKVFYPNTGLC